MYYCDSGVKLLLESIFIVDMKVLSTRVWKQLGREQNGQYAGYIERFGTKEQRKICTGKVNMRGNERK